MIVCGTEIPSLVVDDLIEAARAESLKGPFLARGLQTVMVSILRRHGIKPVDNGHLVHCQGLEYDTSPMPMRLTDRIIQKLRKAGEIRREHGWWTRT